MEYRITIPEPRNTGGKLITVIVALANLLAFSFAFYYTDPLKAESLTGLGFALSVATIVLLLVKNFTRFLQAFKVEIAFGICILIWFASGQFIPGILLTIALVFLLKSSKQPVVVFNKGDIRLPSLPPKEILWSEVDFVMIKDGVLTIELKNNHLFQYTLSAIEAEKINETDFNTFCAGIVSSHEEVGMKQVSVTSTFPLKN